MRPRPPQLRDSSPTAESLELHYPTLRAARDSGLTLVDIREGWERATDDPERQIEMHVPLSAFVEGAAALPDEGRYLVVRARAAMRSPSTCGRTATARCIRWPAVWPASLVARGG